MTEIANPYLRHDPTVVGWAEGRNIAAAAVTHPLSILAILLFVGGGMEMRGRLVRATTVAFVSALVGCASPAPKIDLAADAAGSLETITLVRPPKQQQLIVQNLAHPGMAFGAIGGLIAASDLKDKTAQFNKALAQENFSFADTLTAAVERKLKEAGYQVKVEDGAWVEKGGKYTLANDQLPGDGPVLILATAVAGFVSTVSDDYMPSIWLVARLMAKDRTTEVYRGYHSTGWAPMGKEWKYTKATRSFKNFGALMANPSDSGAAISDASEVIATSIAEDLRRSGTTTARVGTAAYKE
jgi:hypothetical protein